MVEERLATTRVQVRRIDRAVDIEPPYPFLRSEEVVYRFAEHLALSTLTNSFDVEVKTSLIPLRRGGLRTLPSPSRPEVVQSREW